MHLTFSCRFVMLQILSWIWTAIGYFVFLFNTATEIHLFKIRAAFAPPLSIKKSPDGLVEEISPSPLAGVSEGSLPDWCFIDLPQYIESRSSLSRFLSSGRIPNRIQALFLAGQNAPKLHLFYLRMNLVYNGLYCAMLAIVFLPVAYNAYTIEKFLIYLVLSVVPILTVLFNKKHLILMMVQVMSIGTFRAHGAVSQALREEKTAQAVRRMVIIHKLRGAAKGQTSMVALSLGATKPGGHVPLNAETVREVSRTFDMIDRNGDSVVTGDEFRAFMLAVGVPMNDEDKRSFLNALGSGDEEGKHVTAESFLQWYADQTGRDGEHDIKDCAAFLFGLFDHDGNGSITISELKEGLDSLDMGFTIDEVGELAGELDHRHHGIITEGELMEMLEKHYPKELVLSAVSWGVLA